ncbi:iron-sulfur cluster repair di-iron protein [bacterium SCSIO 12643]|nr:iron-sulfur cluster repair di-iron protein [bacterium SCSIO 12643]
MQNLADKTVAEIVTENIKTADVFKKNGIDFCCGGNVNVAKACERKGLDVDQIVSELNDSLAEKGAVHDYNSWELDFLIDYIMNTHHAYVRGNAELMLQYTQRVATVHGVNHPEVVRINQLAYALVEELGPHLLKEENILFPYVKQLLNAKRNNTPVPPPGFGTVQNPIHVMHNEHDGAGDIIKEIAELSNNFTPPADACNTYKAMYAKLEEFQNDLFQHIHLENNVLFPKAIELENSLL